MQNGHKVKDDILNQVDDFVYLGGTISTNHLCDNDMVRRVGLAAGIAWNVDKLWKAKDISKETKIMIYTTMVIHWTLVITQ